jgi:predicted GNAT superfamily acetyltransferase
VRIRVPWEIAELKQAQPDVAARIQAEVREQFLKWSREGYAATGFEIGEREEVYVLERWERAPEAAPARDS